MVYLENSFNNIFETKTLKGSKWGIWSPAAERRIMTEILKHAKYVLLFSGLEALSVSKLVCFHLFSKCLLNSALSSCMRLVLSTIVHGRGLALSGKIRGAHMLTGARI